MAFIRIVANSQLLSNRSDVFDRIVGDVVDVVFANRRVIDAVTEHGELNFIGRFDPTSEETLGASDLLSVSFTRRVDGGLGFSISNLSGVTFDEFARANSFGQLASFKGNAGLSVSASSFDDILVGSRQRDVMRGRNGDDILRGAQGNDWLSGDHGNDILFGHTGRDDLYGGAGDDRLNGQGGSDRMFGGFGDDRYWVHSSGDRVFEGPGNGEDLVLAAVTFRAPAGIENVTLTGGSWINAWGNGGDNILTGNAGRNVLIGFSGDDVLNGGRGPDRTFGGAGDDVYFINVASDRVGEGPALGNDTVWSPVDYTLPPSVENLQLRGSGGTDGTGNASDNVLVGNSGPNVLRGLDGDDALFGGPGADRLEGGGGADDFVFDSAPGMADQIVDFTPGIDRLVLDTNAFTALIPDQPVTPHFRAVGDAADGDDYLVYDQAPGILYYEAAGDGTDPLEPIADFADGLSLSAADVLASASILADRVPDGGLAITADATALGNGRGALMSSDGGEFVRIDLLDNIV